MDEYREGLRDYSNGQIAKLGKFVNIKSRMKTKELNKYQLVQLFLELADAEEVYAKIVHDFPNYLTAHISLIQKLEVAEAKNALPFTFKASLDKTNSLDATLTTLRRVISLAEIVIKETNAETLLAFYGLKSDTRPDAAKIKR